MKRLFLFLTFTIFVVSISSQSKQISLTDIWGSRVFLPNRIDEIRSMNDGESYTILKNNSIIQYSYKSGKDLKTILKGEDLQLNGLPAKIEIEDYHFSADESMILITTNINKIYRRSYFADYYVYIIKTKELIPLSVNGQQRLAEISPDGKKVAFVKDNNIFLFDLTSRKEKQITIDGEFNKIIYGAPDWVYEEEFKFSKGFFWSPDGSKIAYYRFDESHVNEFTIMRYNGGAYPELYTYKYPKAGEPNSLIEIYVYHLESEQHVKMDIGSETDIYIPRIGWTQNSDEMWFQLLNRHQNVLKIFVAQASSGQSKVIYTETNKYYIDITDNLTFLKDEKRFLITSELDGYNHIYIYNMDGTLHNQVTRGNWDVFDLVHIDQRGEILYYTSSENGPINTMLYSIDFAGKSKKQMFEKEGYYRVDFSNNSKYFILNYSTANSPPQYAIFSTKPKKLVSLEENKDLISSMKDYGFVKKEFFKFTTSENIELNGWMMKPEKLLAGKKYPVLMYVYGGPYLQTVKNEWGWHDFIWFQMLVQNGIIVVSVDNRGTCGRGEEFKKSTYLQLGKLETKDQIEAAKYLGSLPYIDKNNIGIFGWSYGGFISSLCMTKGADVFKAGIAVAPVTNWIYYDNIYTERFMRTPQENPDGYENNSPIYHANKLKGPFLIVHGDADDNVHVQNTHEFVNALVSANKQFDMFIFPNRNHGIYGGWTRLHLYTKMTNFLYKHLKRHD